MAAWKCKSCEIKFPANFTSHVGGKTCPACEGTIEYGTNWKPDTDWADKLDHLILGTKAEEPNALDWPSPHPEDDSAPILYRNDVDRVEVTDQTLRNLGYAPEPFDVVRLNGTYYELLDYHAQPKTWTIERFNFEKTRRQIKRLPVYRKPKPPEIEIEIIYDDE